jgi:prepilin-type N-terminal cleavage/methylation domain-containing protein
MIKQLKKHGGFTLIELMVVMAIVALLMSMVGPLAINAVDKANARQEMLTMKNWLRKISYRAFATGNSYQLKLSGNKVELFLISSDTTSNINEEITDESNKQIPVISRTFAALFFQPQALTYNANGFVSPTSVNGQYRGKTMLLNLDDWINHQEKSDEN